MAFDILRTRKGKLRAQIEYELSNDVPDIDKILEFIDLYEKNNLDTIKKLERKKKNEIKKISGALKQTINAHGPITKELIGSASKRIFGSLLEVKKESFITKLLNIFK
jgi:hypothetical protein